MSCGEPIPSSAPLLCIVVSFKTVPVKKESWHHPLHAFPNENWHIWISRQCSLKLSVILTLFICNLHSRQYCLDSADSPCKPSPLSPLFHKLMEALTTGVCLAYIHRRFCLDKPETLWLTFSMQRQNLFFRTHAGGWSFTSVEVVLTDLHCCVYCVVCE